MILGAWGYFSIPLALRHVFLCVWALVAVGLLLRLTYVWTRKFEELVNAASPTAASIRTSALTAGIVFGLFLLLGIAFFWGRDVAASPPQSSPSMLSLAPGQTPHIKIMDVRYFLTPRPLLTALLSAKARVTNTGGDAEIKSCSSYWFGRDPNKIIDMIDVRGLNGTGWLMMLTDEAAMRGVTFTEPYRSGPATICGAWLPFDQGDTRVFSTGDAVLDSEEYAAYINERGAYVFDVFVVAENTIGASDAKHLCYMKVISSSPVPCTRPGPRRDLYPSFKPQILQ